MDNVSDDNPVEQLLQGLEYTERATECLRHSTQFALAYCDKDGEWHSHWSGSLLTLAGVVACLQAELVAASTVEGNEAD